MALSGPDGPSGRGFKPRPLSFSPLRDITSFRKNTTLEDLVDQVVAITSHRNARCSDDRGEHKHHVAATTRTTGNPDGSAFNS